jgi:hypothetical protein
VSAHPPPPDPERQRLEDELRRLRALAELRTTIQPGPEGFFKLSRWERLALLAALVLIVLGALKMI